MGKENSSFLKKGFNPAELVSISQDHEQQLKNLSDRLEVLENRVGTDAAFAETFEKAQRESKRIDETVEKIVDSHDNHKIKVNGIALLKWVAGIIIGSVLTWLFTQAVIIPQYNQKIDMMQDEINKHSSSP